MTGPGFTLARVEWADPRAVDLRGRMDVEMRGRYTRPSSPALAEQVRRALTVDPADVLATVLALDREGTAIAHAALRTLRGEWEVKRVVVDSDHRGRGVGQAVMTELEAIARPRHARRLILQTGDRQPEAVALYERLGYTPIPIYQPYVLAIPFSLCFQKVLG